MLPESDPIRQFYTDHPYPPPVENLDRARDEWRDPNRRRADFHLLWPHRAYRDEIDILVAGCGTWQAAKYALCWPAATVVGIDVSQTSIEHTERLKRQYDLTNLDTARLPIEDVATLGREFDLVVCTGVLHHLGDPGAGLRALRSVLKPGGAIYGMVYAPFGRAGVYMIQEYCRRLGIGASAAEIDDLLATLKTLPQHHPLAALLRSSRDGTNPDALADALLNPRDRAYTVPQLFDFIAQSGCAFGRWYAQAPYLVQCSPLATTPHAARLAALSFRDQSAAIELWRGSMATHSFIAYRSDGDGPSAVRFDDGRWRRYVPIRLPWTVCLRERLPAGAAAVLLNRSHQYTDLILTLDAQDKLVFDAIDGRRSIADIATIVGGDNALDRSRALFDRLWRFDQVVFDMTGRDLDRHRR